MLQTTANDRIISGTIPVASSSSPVYNHQRLNILNRVVAQWAYDPALHVLLPGMNEIVVVDGQWTFDQLTEAHLNDWKRLGINTSCVKEVIILCFNDGL